MRGCSSWHLGGRLSDLEEAHCAACTPCQGVLGVIDGLVPTEVEDEEDKKKRHDFLRMIGYKR